MTVITHTLDPEARRKLSACYRFLLSLSECRKSQAAIGGNPDRDIPTAASTPDRKAGAHQ